MKRYGIYYKTIIDDEKITMPSFVYDNIEDAEKVVDEVNAISKYFTHYVYEINTN